MAHTFKKDPNDIVDFSINWDALLDVGETITGSTYTFFLLDGTATTEITEDSSSTSDPITTIFIAGGVVNTKYQVSNKITTSDGRTYERTFFLYIQELYA